MMGDTLPLNLQRKIMHILNKFLATSLIRKLIFWKNLIINISLDYLTQSKKECIGKMARKKLGQDWYLNMLPMILDKYCNLDH